MKKLIIITVIVSMFPLAHLTAQNSNREKLEAFKIGFFTKKLNLTSQEAEKFWPVYNDYQKEKNLIQRDKISIIRNFNQNESTLNDEQLNEMGDKLVNFISQDATIAVSFHKKLKEVLPPAKVVRFYQAEAQYKIQLLRELQEDKPQLRGRGGRGL